VILVDTSIWVDHLRHTVGPLTQALEADDVLVHPLVIGELACAMLKNRHEVLHLLSALPRATIATDDEVLLFIDERKLFGKGIGYIDTHVLASVALTPGAQLWTRDKRLRTVAEAFRLALPA
jgi:predicted nucleic acid-binding protein